VGDVLSITQSRGGFVAQGYEPVAEEFERNFAERGELGAAFAVSRGGEPVVDLWGGVADRVRRRPWAADTLQIVFSGTKGLVAICMLILLERGELALEAPVAAYWPEFAEAGKEGVLVRDVVAHTARLPGLEAPVTWREATDARRMAALIAAQPQSGDPRAAGTYHALTYGWLCGELVRRVDGRSIGRFFAEEVARPLELELWIGLPEELEPRVSRVELAPSWGSSPAFTVERLAADPLLRSVFANPVRYQPESFPWNERDWHAAEVPAANGIGTARSIARLYGSLGRVLSPETLELGRRPLSTRQDTLLGRPTSFGVGFQLLFDESPLGRVPGAFGHGGSGGSVHGRWPDAGLGFSYAMNLMRDDPGDLRAAALLGALHASVERIAGR
jgi:CubicO group peptidase (beta-lactamase class C family)